MSPFLVYVKISDVPFSGLNGKLRAECLNQHWFLSLDDAQEVVEAWREDYNRNRPHSALGDRSPAEFAIFSAGASPR